MHVGNICFTYTCINRTPVCSEHKSQSQEGLIQTCLTVLTLKDYVQNMADSSISIFCISYLRYKAFNIFQVYLYFTIYRRYFVFNVNKFHEYFIQHSLKSAGTKDHFRGGGVKNTWYRPLTEMPEDNYFKSVLSVYQRTQYDCFLTHIIVQRFIAFFWGMLLLCMRFAEIVLNIYKNS